MTSVKRKVVITDDDDSGKQDNIIISDADCTEQDNIIIISDEECIRKNVIIIKSDNDRNKHFITIYCILYSTVLSNISKFERIFFFMLFDILILYYYK